MRSILACAVVVLLAVNVATGLECYDCEEDDKNNCSWESKTCPAAATHCFKISVERPDGVEYIKRGCIGGDDCEVISKGVKILLQTLFRVEVNPNCITCLGDKCNSAPKLTGFTLFGLIVAAVAFLV